MEEERRHRGKEGRREERKGKATVVAHKSSTSGGTLIESTAQSTSVQLPKRL